MKKLLPVILCLVLVAMLAGCGAQNDQPAAPDVPETPETPVVDTESKAYQALSLAQEDALGAVVYLGGSADGTDWNKMVQEGVLSALSADEAAAIQAIDLGGSDVYLVVTRYDGETMKVTEMKMDETTGEINPTENVKNAAGSAVIVICNPSDLFSNVQITMDYNGDTVTFSPFISLMDGSVTTDARVPALKA